jgi:hypothetical protein
MSDQIAATEARQEGFYLVVLGQNPPEIAHSERGEWWLAGDPNPWQSEAGPSLAIAWYSSRAWCRATRSRTPALGAQFRLTLGRFSMVIVSLGSESAPGWGAGHG